MTQQQVDCRSDEEENVPASGKIDVVVVMVGHVRSSLFRSFWPFLCHNKFGFPLLYLFLLMNKKF